MPWIVVTIEWVKYRKIYKAYISSRIKMKIKNLYNTSKKKLLLGALGLATIIGTYSGNEEGFTPFYNRKVGKSGGINIGFYTEFMPGSDFYGANISLINKIEGGTVYGANLSFGNKNKGGTINGLNLGILANTHRVAVEEENNSKVNGLEVAILLNTNKKGCKPSIVNGLQMSILNNSAQSGNCAQIGLYNEIEKENKKMKKGFLLNYHFRGKGK